MICVFFEKLFDTHYLIEMYVMHTLLQKGNEMIDRMMSMLEEVKQLQTEDLSQSQSYTDTVSSITESCDTLSDQCISSRHKYVCYIVITTQVCILRHNNNTSLYATS